MTELLLRNMVWVWTGWLVLLVLTFAVLEGIALARGGLTLSMYTWHLSEQWPPIIWLCGVLAGGLAVHFWWHWAPPSTGQLGGTGG